MEIIVSCNGCTDATAEIARSFGFPVRVHESRTASKIAALNAAEALASHFPRVYMDADITLEQGALQRIAEALADPGTLMASPAMRMDMSASSWTVRAYYRLWTALPYIRSGMIGTGIYALSRAGRQRFDRFPEVIADDGYVRLLFAPHERRKLCGVHSTITAPRGFFDLLKIKTRSRLGEFQLRQRYPELVVRDRSHKNYGGGLGGLALRPTRWLDASIYLIVSLGSRLRARRQLKTVGSYSWEKDATSRLAV